MSKLNKESGFTLIEMIVAVGLFAVVMLICTGALLAVVGANRKAQALQSVMNNLNIALDGMVRSIRMGHYYECGGTTPINGNGVHGNDCTEGAAYMSFIPFGADDDNAEAWVYSYDGTAKRIAKSEDGGQNYVWLTSPEISVDSVDFYVIGTRRGANDPTNTQPKVVIVIKGTAGADTLKTRTSFNIQATAVQRVLDL